MEISVIIPAYNEEQRIKPTIHSVIAYLESKYTNSYELIVVTDGSRDKTVEVVSDLQRQYPAIQVIVNQVNRGKGAVVKQGILASQGKYVLFMDADNSTHIEELDSMMPIVKTGVPIVIASRDLSQSQVKIRQTWWKELLGDLGNLWIQILLVGGIKDTQCGFKLFDGEIGRSLFAELTMTGWAFDIEVLALARLKRYSIYESPIVWYNDHNSHVTLLGYLEVLRDTLVIKYRIWTRSYF